MVRVNAVDTEWCERDVDEMVCLIRSYTQSVKDQSGALADNSRGIQLRDSSEQPTFKP